MTESRREREGTESRRERGRTESRREREGTESRRERGRTESRRERGVLWLHSYRIEGFFRGRKLLRISCFCGDLRKFSPRKSIFKQLDTALVGVVHWVTANSRKFFPRENLFPSNS